MALKGLPKFTCLPEDKGQYGPTIHLLPDEKDVMRQIKEGFAIPGVTGSVDFRANGADVDNEYFLGRIRVHGGYTAK